MSKRWTDASYVSATSVTSDDLFLLVNDPAGSPTSQKVSFGTLVTSIKTVGQLLNFTDASTEAEIYRNDGAELVLATNSSKHLVLSGSRLIRTVDNDQLVMVGGTAKSTAAFLEFFGQDNGSGPGYVILNYKNGGVFRVASHPNDTISGTTRLEIDGFGVTDLITEFDNVSEQLAALRIAITDTDSGADAMGLEITVGGTSVFAIRKDGAPGFYGAIPTSQDTGWTTFTNLLTLRTVNADTATAAQLADILGTLIEKLKATGIISA